MIWITFFLNMSNLRSQKKLNKNIDKLKNAKIYYENEIKKDSFHLYKLKKDSSFIEKFAREKYFFKKKGEDIFIIEKNKHE